MKVEHGFLRCGPRIQTVAEELLLEIPTFSAQNPPGKGVPTLKCFPQNRKIIILDVFGIPSDPEEPPPRSLSLSPALLLSPSKS